MGAMGLGGGEDHLLCALDGRGATAERTAETRSPMLLRSMCSVLVCPLCGCLPAILNLRKHYAKGLTRNSCFITLQY